MPRGEWGVMKTMVIIGDVILDGKKTKARIDVEIAGYNDWYWLSALLPDGTLLEPDMVTKDDDEAIYKLLMESVPEMLAGEAEYLADMREDR